MGVIRVEVITCQTYITLHYITLFCGRLVCLLGVGGVGASNGRRRRHFRRRLGHFRPAKRGGGPGDELTSPGPPPPLFRDENYSKSVL